MADKPFRVIEGGEPAAPARKPRHPAHLIKCRQCGGQAVIEVKLGMEYRDGKPRGGQKRIVCAHCFLKGEYVVLVG